MSTKQYWDRNPQKWDAPYLEVILSRGKTAKIDPDDYPKVKSYGHWRVYRPSRSKTFYAYANDWRIAMHRLIMGYPPYPQFEIDHINGDGLDNRKKNLEVVTGAENLRRAHARLKGKS